MSRAQSEQRFWTRDEYRHWCELQPRGRFERVDGEIVHPVRRFVVHHRRTDAGIATAILSGGPIGMDPPGITVAVEELWEE